MSNPTKPVRLRLSRRKGFDLQATSAAINGLPAANVARPGKWGNPFIISANAKPGSRSGAEYICVPTVEDAVACFREMVTATDGDGASERRAALSELRGKNLACWCKPGDPCHADVLLELANEEP